MALIYYRRGDFPRAKALLERALRIKEHVYGPIHTDVAGGLNNLAYVLMEMGDLASARLLLERAVTIDERILPPDHFELILPLTSLGELLRVMGRPGEARPHLERAVAIIERVVPDAAVLAPVLTSLALALDALGETRLADASLARALVMAEKATDVELVEMANALTQYAAVLRGAGQDAKADQLDEHARALRARSARSGTSSMTEAVGHRAND
jgi:tetratricopeptide (TPR) repeat protein